MEILCFQFKLTKALRSDPSLRERWETCLSRDSGPSTTTQKKHQLILGTCVLTVVKSTTKECLCCHELNACECFKIKKLYVYLLPILQIFFIKLINKHAIINLFLIHNTKRQKVFFCIFFILFLVSQFLYCII